MRQAAVVAFNRAMSQDDPLMDGSTTTEPAEQNETASDDRIHLLATLARLTRLYPATLPVFVILGTAASLAEGFGIALLIPLLGLFLDDPAATAASGPLVSALDSFAARFEPDVRLPIVATTVVALIVLRSAISYANFAFSAWTNGRIGALLRTRVVERLLRLDFREWLRAEPGRLLSTLSEQTWQTVEAMNHFFLLVINACTAVVFVTLLFLISWPLSLVMAAGVALVSLVAGSLAKRTRARSYRVLDANQSLSTRMLQLVEGMRTIRVFRQQGREIERFDHASDQVRRETLGVELAAGLVQPLLDVLYVPIFFIALAIAHATGVGLTVLLPFLLLFYRLVPQLRSFDHRRVAVAGLTAAVADVDRLLDPAVPASERRGGTQMGPLRDGIVFDEVTFRYAARASDGAAEPDDGGGEPDLDRVSFTIGKGERVAIVGRSGAGKSTVINLLLGLLEPGSGEIRIDGRSLTTLDLDSWRARLALAGQDIELQGGTIAENVAYGVPGASREAIVEAARRAGVDEFASRLERGYDTIVSERGINLSVGERQRIGLARALLCSPDVLILDEATSALDGITEAAVQRLLAATRGQMTVVMIAHRLSSIEAADRVVVLERGRVVETGETSQLLRSDSRFALLYQGQIARDG